MCLSSITSLDPPKSGIGYKVLFRVSRDKSIYTTPYCFYDGELRLGITARNRRFEQCFLYYGKYYYSGFHIFVRLKDAVRYIDEEMFAYHAPVILKVRYNQCKVRGLQRDKVCVVADEMTLLKEVPKWKEWLYRWFMPKSRREYLLAMGGEGVPTKNSA